MQRVFLLLLCLTLLQFITIVFPTYSLLHSFYLHCCHAHFPNVLGSGMQNMRKQMSKNNQTLHFLLERILFPDVIVRNFLVSA